ncbi:hypothetical protein SRU_0250 [Salinibacter ruber DSM 13855]|uniref:Uncharacterized protein n=1 Tax=Salinibacter ruber (strain DSM 13855 / M31) TaxID=309807 RepID=Q2S5Y5_SALRD|nr:hypothetical protein SRU_0250 [Salinibacter ruber DSM 13855]
MLRFGAGLRGVRSHRILLRIDLSPAAGYRN